MIFFRYNKILKSEKSRAIRFHPKYLEDPWMAVALCYHLVVLEMSFKPQSSLP